MKSGREKRVLALDVHSSSFAYTVFEGPNMLLDWGIRSFPRGVNVVRVPAAKKLGEMLEEFSPTVIVINDRLVYRTRRYAGLVRAVVSQAEKHHIPVRFFGRKIVQNAFAGNERNRHRIACVLAARFPELAPRLPARARRVQDREDYRMSIFDAAALGVTYFSSDETTQVEPVKQPSACLDSWQGSTISL